MGLVTLLCLTQCIEVKMDIKDLAGLSAPITKLIEVISSGVGTATKPYLIKRTADAKAYEINKIAQAIKDNQHDLKNIGFTEEKLSLMSLDTTLKNESSVDIRAQQRVDFKEQKRQRNIESITQEAASELESEESVSDEAVDEDWTSRFFNYAEDISNEEMQELWGKILAGEIKKPKSYSLRALDLLRNLSTEEAEVFIKFGTLAITSSNTTFILNLNKETLLENKYNLTFPERLLLEELGLLTANDLNFKVAKTESNSRAVVFKIGNQIIIQEKIANKPDQSIQVLGFTKIGKELLQLVDTKPDLDYLELLAIKLGRQNGDIKYGTILAEYNNGKISHTPLVDIPLNDFKESN